MNCILYKVNSIYDDDWDFDTHLYYISKYNNHDSIITSNEFIFFEMPHTRVKYQLLKFYKYNLIKKNV